MCMGIPYLDVRGNHDVFVMIQTVQDKFSTFTEKQVEKAIESCNIQARIVHPTNDNFKLIILVSSKSLDKCSVVSSDVTNAHNLFGPNRPYLRGETVQQRPERVIL